MLLATLLRSMAGVVTRHLVPVGPFEATFWRSLFNAAALLVLLGALRGGRPLLATLRQGGATRAGDDGNGAAPYRTHRAHRASATPADPDLDRGRRCRHRHRLDVRPEAGAATARQLVGMAIAAGVPVAAALNSTIIKKGGAGRHVLVGGALVVGALVANESLALRRACR